MEEEFNFYVIAEKWRRESKKIFGEGKYLFVEEKKKQRRKRRKIFEEEYIFCCGEEQRRRKRKKILGEQDHPMMNLALDQTIISGLQTCS